MQNMEISDSRAVFGEDECIYQCVLEDFKNAKFIGIMTFNISPRADSLLLKCLKDACLNGTDAVIFTNIPQRYSAYYARQYAMAAKDRIKLYLQQLNPYKYGMRLKPYFTFHNHAKIVMTDNIVYWGSSNYSDESHANVECGAISTDSKLIDFLKDTLFPDIQKKSIPYYRHNFAEAIVNIEGLIQICKKARKSLIDAAFEPWAEYETHFKEKWVYRTSDSGLTEEFLQGFIESFAQFDDALNVIDDIIDECREQNEISEKDEMLETVFEEYKKTYRVFLCAVSSVFEKLKPLAQYDVSIEACGIIEKEYSYEAYDEQLDHYVEKAMNAACDKYMEIIEQSESEIRDALKYLDSMIQHFRKIETRLYQLLEVNPKIDNTGIE